MAAKLHQSTSSGFGLFWRKTVNSGLPEDSPALAQAPEVLWVKNTVASPSDAALRRQP